MLRTPPPSAPGSCNDFPAAPFFAVEEAEVEDCAPLPVAVAVLLAPLLVDAAVGSGVALLNTCPTVGKAALGLTNHPPGVEVGHAGGLSDEAEAE